jgi:hypothetical protein
MTAYYTGRKTNYALRLAVQLALGRFHPTRLEEAAARIQARIQLEQHQRAVKRMERAMKEMPLKIARDPNPIRHSVNLA